MSCSQLSLKAHSQLLCSRIYSYFFSLFLICFVPEKISAEQVSVTSLQAAFISRFIDFTEKPDFKDKHLKICVQLSENAPKKEDFEDMGSYPVPVSVEFFSGNSFKDDCSLLISDRHLLTNHKVYMPLKIVLNEDRCSTQTHIRFVLQNNKLRFAVNLQKTKKDGFELSSKLLALAIIEDC